jgi:hypothetical protein
MQRIIPSGVYRDIDRRDETRATRSEIYIRLQAVGISSRMPGSSVARHNLDEISVPS